MSNPSAKTEDTFAKGHHPPRYTSDHQPPTPSKSESKCSVLTPEQRSPDRTSPDRTTSPIPTMGTVKDLADALTEKLKDFGRHPTIPLPQFRGKKGEDPNDHCMKVEDYLSIFKIESDDDQKKRFLESLFEKARRWASTTDIDKLDGNKYQDRYT